MNKKINFTINLKRCFIKNIVIFTIIMVDILLVHYKLDGQNVGIGTSNPHPSARLEVNDNTRGLLIPRMTTAERDAIANPANSLLIFNTTTQCFEFWNAPNSTWISLGCGCHVPGSFTANAASSVTSTSFTANWSTASGATLYFLDVATNSTFTNFVPGYNNLNVGNVTSHNVTGLTCNTAYYYRIRACNTCGCTDNSNTINVTTSPGALPTAPTATAATLITTSSFRANWGASAGATFYRIDVATDAAFTNILPGYNDLNVGNVIFYNVNGLSCNTTYYYRIRACNTCGCSGNSNVISVATHGIPDPPSVSLYVAGGTADLYGSWGGSPTATTYETDAGTFFAPGNAYLGPADCGVPFTFSARACNSCGCSSWVTANLTYYGPPCP